MKIFKNLKKKIQKRLNNQGSSIIMVIVALGFLAVIVAALLSSAVYVYKLKLQELNSRNNFYYVEQAMQEIYAGVGVNTIDEMKKAYAYTVENMVYYDTTLGEYVTLEDDVANKLFKKKFLENITSSDYFESADSLATTLEGYISNESVDLDNAKLSVNVSSDGVVIKDITLTRIQNYENSSANGTYVQTVSADIVISEPDFDVTFNQISAEYPTIFDYAIVADMGVEVTQGMSTPLNIVGNIYAAADFYNKGYDTGLTAGDMSSGLEIDGTKLKIDGMEKPYDFSAVTSKDSTKTDATGYVFIDPTSGSGTGMNYTYNVARDGLDVLTYDGINERSSNSGFYISNSKVSILTDKMIVPGTIAVMNEGSLSVFGGGSKTSTPEVWADNFVLGGSSKKSASGTYSGSDAYIKANMYIRDDAELNAKGSSFTLIGGYYGYGNATLKDNRAFGPMVDPISFVIQDATGNTFNRGHYNSSSIVLNGDGSKLDLSKANTLFLAGRAYIEFSKKVTSIETVDATTHDSTFTETVVYRPKTTDNTSYIRDYETAESISFKSNQIMYDMTYLGTMGRNNMNHVDYNCIVLPDDATLRAFFNEFFPSVIFANCIITDNQTIDGLTYCFIDFANAYAIMADFVNNSAGKEATKVTAAQNALKKDATTYLTLDEFKLKFVEAYTYAMTPNDPRDATDHHYVEALKDIRDVKGFEAGEVVLAENLNETTNNDTTVYSSGAITTKSEAEFEFITDKDDPQFISTLLDSSPATGTTIPAQLSEELQAKYLKLKWNLAPYEAASLDQEFITEVNTKFGEDDITPINKYVIMSRVNRNLLSYDVGGNKIWISSDTVTITGGANISGIIITKGDVVFASDVKNFQGLIIAGGKVYIANGLDSISASPTTCRAILRSCLASSGEDEQYILSLFKQYEDYEMATTTDAEGDVSSIDAIDYTDVVSVENWMKNLGGDYDAEKKSSLN